MIHTFRAKNYGCLLDVAASLTPLHAFIGPNDNGKSTLLHGLRTLTQLASDKFTHEDGVWAPFDPFFPYRFPKTADPPVNHGIRLMCDVDGGSYSYVIEADTLESINMPGDGGAPSIDPYFVRRPEDTGSTSRFVGPQRVITSILAQLTPARMVRFDPDALREPSGLIPETTPVSFLDDRGHGLAGVYFAIRNRDDNAFSSILADVRRHFPTIKGLRVKAISPGEVVLEAELTSGARVEARRMSEGLLYYLAFTALRHLDRASLLLVEEPENGLHPARIAEVVRALRAIVTDTGTQVLMATHSPLVVNELTPDEVSVVTRSPERGTRVTRIKDTPNFEERAKVYALGELWLSYANGSDEAPLLDGGPRP
jgi:energy-coupling factor transporter ATP-binding protein EcfA2